MESYLSTIEKKNNKRKFFWNLIFWNKTNVVSKKFLKKYKQYNKKEIYKN